MHHLPSRGRDRVSPCQARSFEDARPRPHHGGMPSFLRDPARRLLVVYVVAGVVAAALSLALDQSRNLTVYRDAARDLLAHRDLYAGTSVDWFKYSPTFALLFVPLASLPPWPSAI